MALPIESTPVLEGDEADRFLETILRDQNIAVSLIPTPKLQEVERKIREYYDRSPTQSD